MSANQISSVSNSTIGDSFFLKSIQPAQTSPKQIMRCGLYARGQNSKVIDSRFERLERLLEYTKSHSNDTWEVVGQYVDVAQPRSCDPPPGLQRLIDDINNGTVNCVLVCNMAQLLQAVKDPWLCRFLETIGVSIICETRPLPY